MAPPRATPQLLVDLPEPIATWLLEHGLQPGDRALHALSLANPLPISSHGQHLGPAWIVALDFHLLLVSCDGVRPEDGRAIRLDTAATPISFSSTLLHDTITLDDQPLKIALGQRTATQNLLEHIHAQPILNPKDSLHTLTLADSLHKNLKPHKALSKYLEFIQNNPAPDDPTHIFLPLPKTPEPLQNLLHAHTQAASILHNQDPQHTPPILHHTLRALQLYPLDTRPHDILHDTLPHTPPHLSWVHTRAAHTTSLLKPSFPLPNPPIPPTPLDLSSLQPINTTTHNTLALHPLEQSTSSSLGRLVAGLIHSPTPTDDIQRHCQRATSASHPNITHILSHVSHALSIPTPSCYLSHNNIGVQLLGSSDNPILLLGFPHTDPDDPRFLHPNELLFTLATQLAHIRADHLILTNSEFWFSFASRSLDSISTLLSILPIAGWLGKLTDSAATSLLTKLSQNPSKTLDPLLKLAKPHIQSGKAGEGAQAALQSALDKLRSSSASAAQNSSTDTLAKTGLASFARAALYTADRVALALTNDLHAATHAIFKLSFHLLDELQPLHTHGLAHILSRTRPDGRLLFHETALRLGQLSLFSLHEDLPALQRALQTPNHEDNTP